MQIYPVLPDSPSFTNVYLSATGELVFGDGATDDDWKIKIDGDNLIKQVRISGSFETAHKTERPV